MSTSTPKPSLGAGLLVAFVLSASGAAVLAATAPWLGGATALRTVIAALGFAYTLYMIARSGERVGRITTVVCWLAVAGGAWVIGLPLGAYVLVHIGLVWLVRSLYHYSGVLSALADLGIAVLGAAFAVWAAQRSGGGTWLALWCFFLVQAFHVFIPATLTSAKPTPVDDDSFASAHRAAEAAVRRLSSSTR
jgi:hypothetical protein